MKRKTTVLALVVILLIGATAVGLFVLSPVRNTPHVTVEGGFVQDATPHIATVRTQGFNLTIVLTSEFPSNLNLYQVNVTNIDPQRFNIECTSEYGEVSRDGFYRVLEIRTAVSSVIFHIYRNLTNNPLNFYVLGDSQGYRGGLTQVITAANENRPDFVFHCGDMTPFGQENQYRALIQILDELTVPFFSTAGNHDTRLGGGQRYENLFGSSTYSFDLDQAHFVVFNSSSGDPSYDVPWLRDDLSRSNAEWKFVFTHIPPFDPRSGENHTLDNTLADELMTLFEENEVDVVFSGHIHMFNMTTIGDIKYVVTGGTGVSLYADSESGGFYHYVNATLENQSLTIVPVILETPTFQQDIVTISGHDETVTLTINDLLVLSTTEGVSSFQNQYDNWRGQGVYTGVKVADLLELVGDMSTSDRLRVHAIDGFAQDFSYSNVYPNSSWYDYQGDMILAYSYNETLVPEWSDGFRLVMLPDDEAFSNNDCLATSAPGMGCNVYSSAGARWVRFVVHIEVMPE